ncbi:hypothetical protein AC578_7654 [Pseudocercospora eumusae]|uniref:CS domain-containing protein n=1 Tax=Pseudocercospora eumusae TaxID=321146 RepID=A0A139H655_9PEZI|nr:hypothetical protein AC578_7654 [Pseudocercospora eumusae]
MSAQPTNTTDAKEFGGKQITPEVTWAQRSSKTEAEKNHIFLSINVVDVDPKKIKLDIQPTKLTFSGYSESKKAEYAVSLEFYDEIEPSASKVNHSPRAVEMVLQKKELKEEYWPRLLKDTKKVHFLKTDFDKVSAKPRQDSLLSASALAFEPEPPPSLFQHEPSRPPSPAPVLKSFLRNSKVTHYAGVVACWFTILTFAFCTQWVDEDEQDAVADDDDYMSRMGGGMGGMGGDGGFGGIDFSKLGGMGGAGMGGEDDEEEDDDDDDKMPELEGEDDAKEGAAGAADKGKKIEEVE